MKLQNAVKETQSKTHSVDVTLVCADNQRIEAHKVSECECFFYAPVKKKVIKNIWSFSLMK